MWLKKSARRYKGCLGDELDVISDVKNANEDSPSFASVVGALAIPLLGAAFTLGKGTSCHLLSRCAGAARVQKLTRSRSNFLTGCTTTF